MGIKIIRSPLLLGQIPIAVFENHVENSQDFRQIFKRVQRCLVNLVFESEFIKFPALSISDDAKDFDLSPVIIVIPLTF